MYRAQRGRICCRMHFFIAEQNAEKESCVWRSTFEGSLQKNVEFMYTFCVFHNVRQSRQKIWVYQPKCWYQNPSYSLILVSALAQKNRVSVRLFLWPLLCRAQIMAIIHSEVCSKSEQLLQLHPYKEARGVYSHAKQRRIANNSSYCLKLTSSSKVWQM